MATNNNEELRRRNKDGAQNAALFWIKLANQSQSEIVRQLLGLSAVVLPLSASFIVSNIKLSQDEKILLVLGWVFFLVSIVAGFVQILVDSNYFVSLSRDSSTREVLWSDTNRSIKETDKDVKALGEVPGSSTTIPLILQGLTFFIGLLLVVVVGTLILINSHSSNIMPSDVCSNKRNKDPQSGIHNVFYHLERGWYKVLPFETIKKAQY